MIYIYIGCCSFDNRCYNSFNRETYKRKPKLNKRLRRIRPKRFKAWLMYDMIISVNYADMHQQPGTYG